MNVYAYHIYNYAKDEKGNVGFIYNIYIKKRNFLFHDIIIYIYIYIYNRHFFFRLSHNYVEQSVFAATAF